MAEVAERHKDLFLQEIQRDTIDDVIRIMDRIGITNIEEIIECAIDLNTTTYALLEKTEEKLNYSLDRLVNPEAK